MGARERSRFQWSLAGPSWRNIPLTYPNLRQKSARLVGGSWATRHCFDPIGRRRSGCRRMSPFPKGSRSDRPSRWQAAGDRPGQRCLGRFLRCARHRCPTRDELPRARSRTHSDASLPAGYEPVHPGAEDRPPSLRERFNREAELSISTIVLTDCFTARRNRRGRAQSP